MWVGLAAGDVADLILAVALRRRVRTARIQPGKGAWEVRLEQVGATLVIPDLPAELAQQTIARLASLAELDPARAGEQTGRLRVRVGDVEAEFVAVVSRCEGGASAGLRRVRAPGAGATTATPIEVDDPLAEGEAAPPGGFGSYRIVGEIGRGGMGVVYRGEHEGLRRPVAIKVLHRDLAAQPQAAARFVREARAACRVRHAGVVDVFDFGTLPDGRAFLVMELVEHETLERLLARRALSPARALGIARQVALALDAIHRHDIVHRDLKPSNIFIGPGDVVKIGDFGAAKVLIAEFARDLQTQVGVIVGTPMYMSPEQVRGQAVDARADIYALGCVLFEMIAGTPPFTGRSPTEVMLQHASRPPPPLTSPYGPVPAALAAAVTRALAKSADARQARALDLLDDLRRAAHKAAGVAPR